MLDTLLSIHCNEDKEGQQRCVSLLSRVLTHCAVHFVTNDMPTTNPEIFTHRPGEAITSIFKMESEDLDRLQSILKYRYTVCHIYILNRTASEPPVYHAACVEFPLDADGRAAWEA